MIVIDTNLFSEPLKLSPEPAVIAWLSRTDGRHCYLPVIVLAELLAGLALLPQGRRRNEKEAVVKAAIMHGFGSDRILDFDAPAAEAYADLTAKAIRTGRPVSVPDGQIAAIAAIRGFAVATRDTAPFRAMGLPVIDPWHPA